MLKTRGMTRIFKGVAGIAALGILAMATLLALMNWDHGKATELPAPTGHFPIGRTMYTWVNDAETDELAPVAGTKREVVVWIWYPAEAPQHAVTGGTTTGKETIDEPEGGAGRARRAEYLPAEWRAALEGAEGPVMSKLLTRDLARVEGHSWADAEVSREERMFPVVILRAGGGALTTDFTTLAEDLASHGYVVAGFDAPYRTFAVVAPDGAWGRRVIRRPAENDPENMPARQAERLIEKLLAMWVEDAKFVASRLEQLNAGEPESGFQGRLDMQRLGMMGHSFGGAQALEFCHEDARCKAGIDIDGAPYGSVVQEGLKQPFLFLLSDHSGEMRRPESQKISKEMQWIYGRLPNGRMMVTIRGANHFSFSDEMLVKNQVAIGLMQGLGISKLEGRRGLAITSEYVHTFFDVYLKGEAAGMLDEIAKKYPEVETTSK
jgi:dienelactone hydrolase